MSRQIKILIVENSSNDTELLMRELYRAGFDPHWLRVDTEADYLANLSPDLDLILSNYALPQFGGSRALALLQKKRLEIPFIIVSGSNSVEIALKVMLEGATDYVLKEQIALFGQVVHQAVEDFEEQRSQTAGQKLVRQAENL